MATVLILGSTLRMNQIVNKNLILGVGDLAQSSYLASSRPWVRAPAPKKRKLKKKKKVRGLVQGHILRKIKEGDGFALCSGTTVGNSGFHRSASYQH